MKPIVAVLFLFFIASYGQAQDNSYHNPVDGNSYVAPNGWKTYTPANGVQKSNEKVRLQDVRLLQSQDELAARTTPEELASFIQLAHQAASQVFASYNKPVVILTQFSCLPGKCTARIASRGQPPDDLLQSYYDNLMRLTPLRVSGEVKFQFTLDINAQ
jgi:hypothetical protein